MAGHSPCQYGVMNTRATPKNTLCQVLFHKTNYPMNKQKPLAPLGPNSCALPLGWGKTLRSASGAERDVVTEESCTSWQTPADLFPLHPWCANGHFCWKGPFSILCSWCLAQEDPELNYNPRCNCNMHRNKSVAHISVSLFCLQITGIF